MSLREIQGGWETAAGKTAGGHSEWTTGGTFPMGQPRVLSLPAAPCPKWVWGLWAGSLRMWGGGRFSPYVVAVGQGPSTCGDQVPRDNGHLQHHGLCWAKSKGDAWTQAAPYPGPARQSPGLQTLLLRHPPFSPVPPPESEQSPALPWGPPLLPRGPHLPPPAKWRLILALDTGDGFGRMRACGWTPHTGLPTRRWGGLRGVLLR